MMEEIKPLKEAEKLWKLREKKRKNLREKTQLNPLTTIDK